MAGGPGGKWSAASKLTTRAVLPWAGGNQHRVFYAFDYQAANRMHHLNGIDVVGSSNTLLHDTIYLVLR
jgi:hypothetical protein